MNFDALDNQPVKLVMLFLVPQGQFQKHLHTLANIAKFLHKPDFRSGARTGSRRRRDAQHHQGIREKMIVELEASDSWQAIDELINKLVVTGKIKPEHRDCH